MQHLNCKIYKKIKFQIHHPEAQKFEKVEDYPGVSQSVIECSNFASIRNQELSDPMMLIAINAFIFDKSAQTCVVGRINYVHLKDMTTWPALTEESTGVHLLYGCVVKGKKQTSL